MTITGTVSDRIQVLEIVPREYEVFGGLDVDHHSIAATFTDHQKLMRSLRLPYSARQLLNYVGKHFPGQRLAFAYEAGPTGFGLCDELMGSRANIRPATNKIAVRSPASATADCATS